MKALIVTCAHAYKNEDGSVYTPSVHSYEFFKRYLKVFDEIEVVARLRNASNNETKGMIPLSGPGLTVCPLPYFRGMKQMIKHLPKIIRSIRKGKKNCNCIIYRVPQMEGYITWAFGGSTKKPFSVEVVADPTGWIHVKGLAKKINVIMLKLMCRKANGATYETTEYLQKIYPPKAYIKGESKYAFTTNYSSIHLEKEDILEPKNYNSLQKPFTIVHISNAIDDDLKGHSTVINVTSKLKELGHEIAVKFIGSGSAIDEFKSYAKQMKVDKCIEFTGRISEKQELLDTMRKCDILLFPTRSEGLPRSVIEAMAVGLPVLSTPVAGIPELVEDKYLRLPDDAQGFTDILTRLLENTDELNEMSKNNVKVASRYTNNILESRRTNFYNKLKAIAK